MQVITQEQIDKISDDLKTTKKDTIFNTFKEPEIVIHKLIGKTVYEHFKYNDRQQLVSRYGKKADSSVTPIYNEVSRINYQYKNDLLVEIRKYNLENTLISSEWEDTPIIQFKYDHKKKLIEKWFLDENGELRAEYAILKYRQNGKDYDWYNIDGKKE